MFMYCLQLINYLNWIELNISQMKFLYTHFLTKMSSLVKYILIKSSEPQPKTFTAQNYNKGQENNKAT